MPITASPDHRRATAERNAAAILDAVERLLARAEPLSIVALAKEAGLSRPTVYAHYPTVGAAVEAAVERTVERSRSAFAAARPEEGPPEQALERLVAASWSQLAGSEGLVRRAREHVVRGRAAPHPRRAHRSAGGADRARARGGRVPDRRPGRLARDALHVAAARRGRPCRHPRRATRRGARARHADDRRALLVLVAPRRSRSSRSRSTRRSAARSRRTRPRRPRGSCRRSRRRARRARRAAGRGRPARAPAGRPRTPGCGPAAAGWSRRRRPRSAAAPRRRRARRCR